MGYGGVGREVGLGGVLFGAVFVTGARFLCTRFVCGRVIVSYAVYLDKHSAHCMIE